MLAGRNSPFTSLKLPTSLGCEITSDGCCVIVKYTSEAGSLAIYYGSSKNTYLYYLHVSMVIKITALEIS
jgi:hypothetical protein